MGSQIKEAFIVSDPLHRCSQGDILRDLKIISATDFNDETGETDVTELFYKYSIVISQECDLEHDFNTRNNASTSNHDKYLPNILIVPAYLFEEFKSGKHRGEDFKGLIWGGSDVVRIKNNNNPRFHFISSDTRYQVPELVIDFKHVQTISRNILYKNLTKSYLATIAELYRESLSHRYSHYLSRIGLPDATGV
jgi:hypothetical protein